MYVLVVGVVTVKQYALFDSDIKKKLMNINLLSNPNLASARWFWEHWGSTGTSKVSSKFRNVLHDLVSSALSGGVGIGEELKTSNTVLKYNQNLT